jgi:hypothetical protein
LLRRWRRRARSTPGAADGPEVHDVPQGHDEVSHYWTDERMREARAREQTRPLPDDD